MFPRFARSWNFESCAVWRQLDPDQESLCYNRKESSAHCFNLVYLKQVKSYLEPIRVGNMRLNWIFAQLTFICTFRLFEWHDLIKSDFIEFKLCWADWIWITSAPPPTLTPTTHSPSTWIPPPPLFQPHSTLPFEVSDDQYDQAVFKSTICFRCQPVTKNFQNFGYLPNAHIGFGKIWTKIWSDDLHDPILDSLENQSQSLSSSVELTWADRSSSSC